jgi:hypothetical protein
MIFKVSRAVKICGVAYDNISYGMRVPEFQRRILSPSSE